MRIIGVCSSTYYGNAQYTAAGLEAQCHGNASMQKSRSHTIVASFVLRALLDRHANQRPYKSRSVLSVEKMVSKIFSSSFK